jgi:hypothetical protein
VINEISNAHRNILDEGHGYAIERFCTCVANDPHPRWPGSIRAPIAPLARAASTMYRVEGE